MAEYIKCEEVNEWLNDLEVIFKSVSPLKPMEKGVISGLLKCTLSKHFVDLPSIDIVHCKECKYWINHDKRCGLLNHGMKITDFCSYGERKDD